MGKNPAFPVEKLSRSPAKENTVSIAIPLPRNRTWRGRLNVKGLFHTR
jgi:hypothetical protein